MQEASRRTGAVSMSVSPVMALLLGVRALRNTAVDHLDVTRGS
jgi:hypothetical protein